MDKATLLCIDDEQKILNTLQVLFKRKYNVIATTDPYEALEFLENNVVHVLISDQRMPIMLGSELLKKAKDISPNTMRILLTGYSDLSAVISSVNEGEIYRFISKPWVNNEVKNVVDSAALIAKRIFANDKLKPIDDSEQAVESMATEFSDTGILVFDNEKQSHQAVYKEFAEICSVYPVDEIGLMMQTLEEHPEIGVVVVDIASNTEDIIEFISVLKYERPEVLTIVTTELTGFQAMVSLINQGQIFRYMVKPLKDSQVKHSVEIALKRYDAYKKTPEYLERHQVATPKVIQEINNSQQNNNSGAVTANRTSQSSSALSNLYGKFVRKLRLFKFS